MLVNRIIRISMCLTLSLISLVAQAQDVLPLPMAKQAELTVQAPLNAIFEEVNLANYQVKLPETFTGVQPSVIVDQNLSLTNFFRKLRSSATGLVRDSVKVLHVGDSHIKGGFFTEKVQDDLITIFPSLSYQDFGVNGATALSFYRENRVDQIKQANPDLLILSFGTNESHSRRYNAAMHQKELNRLLEAIRVVLPDTPILLTTPPGSFDRVRRRVYRNNPRTAKASSLIRTVALEHHLAYWDMYSIVGGKEHACNNWKDAKLIRPDHVHYLPEGYELQANLFCEALIKAYNEYITL